MTTVHQRLSWVERAALALDRGPNRKDFSRTDIPKIRRMANDGKSIDEIRNELGYDMGYETFRKKCKELNITFSRNRRWYMDR